MHYWEERNIGTEFDNNSIIFLKLRIFNNSFFTAMKIINHSSLKWKEIVIIIFILLYNNSVLSQNLDSIIIWNENYKISWDDFLGEKFISKGGVAANSFFVLYYIPGYHKNSYYSYTIIPVFYKYKSSVTDRNSKLLEHEQIHFDVQEIFSRKIRKQFEILKNCKESEYTHRKIFNNYLDSLKNYQKKYDLDTDYSLDKKKQEFWKAIVAKKLKQLDSYSIGNLYHIKKEN